jgi:CHAT domain-containing protein
VQLNYAGLLILQQQTARALPLLSHMDTRLLAYTATQLSTLRKERVRRQLLLSIANFQDVVLTLHRLDPSSETARLAASVVLRWKHMQADEEALTAHLVRTTHDPRIRALGEQMMRLRARLSRRVIPSEAQTPETPVPTLEALEAVELELTRLSQSARDQFAASSADIDRVRSQLPPDGALLEVRSYQPIDFKTGTSGERHWAAVLLLAAAGEAPLIVADLGPVSRTVELWQEMRRATTKDKADLAAAHLYRTLFAAFEAKLQPLKTLYIAPDGVLQMVPLGRLLLPDGRYWIQRQELRYVPTGRDLLRPSPQGSADQLVALGGVDFDQYTKTSQPPSAAVALGHTQTAEELKEFQSLPASTEEANEIAFLYQLARHAPAQTWQGVDASESRLKALPTVPRVLHLATHGFYLSAAADASERPLMNSGLALAGANQGLRGQVGPEGDDGILYSLEVLGLNLHGTEVVALSACDTAHGVIDYAEGIYGLVRAFRIAGARMVLTTLWAVNDTEAKDFMIAFYRMWLQQAISDPAAALRATQLHYIHHRTVSLRDPRVWAPYVLVGKP